MTKCPYGYQIFSFLQWETLFFLNISIFWFKNSTFFQHLVRTKMTMLLFLFLANKWAAYMKVINNEEVFINNDINFSFVLHILAQSFAKKLPNVVLNISIMMMYCSPRPLTIFINMFGKHSIPFVIHRKLTFCCCCCYQIYRETIKIVNK